MEGLSNSLVLLLFLFSVIAAVTSVQGWSTRVGFYARTCPRVESIVKSTVVSHFRSNPAIAPGLLRMHFHDCFVRGCDASILINGSNTERTARPNLQLRGYEVIDDAKAQLEAICPGVVSCADILALAARDSVVVTKGANWEVPTGRRDGRISRASEALNLPAFRDNVTVQRQKFADLGLSAQDLVTLAGGHTIGTSECQFFSYRLYNFTTTTPSGADASIDSAFLPRLRALCPQNGDGLRRIPLDTGSGNRFDTSYFTNMRAGRGILESDQVLWSDPSTRPFVQGYATGGLNFNSEFGEAMVRMSNIGVKVEPADGEIRKICSAVN